MSTPSTPGSEPGTVTSAAPAVARPSLLRWLVRLSVLGFGLAILYALSIGPAVLLNKRGVISAETLERVYFPLSLVIGDIPGSDWLFDRYMRLWADPGPEPR